MEFEMVKPKLIYIYPCVKQCHKPSPVSPCSKVVWLPFANFPVDWVVVYDMVFPRWDYVKSFIRWFVYNRLSKYIKDIHLSNNKPTIMIQ